VIGRSPHGGGNRLGVGDVETKRDSSIFARRGRQVCVTPRDGGGSTINLNGPGWRRYPGTGELARASCPRPNAGDADYRLLKLSKGWILVNVTDLNKRTNNPNTAPTVFDKSNCSVVFTGKVPGAVRLWHRCVCRHHGNRRVDFRICGHFTKDGRSHIQSKRKPDRPRWRRQRNLRAQYANGAIRRAFAASNIPGRRASAVELTAVGPETAVEPTGA
jgi:hypothetical protein